MTGHLLIVKGQVQGVGFRPTVWRVASELGVTGDVRNTGDGVEIRIWGRDPQSFKDRLTQELPSLARIDHVKDVPLEAPPPDRFEIAVSRSDDMRCSITSDAATCPDCLAEIRDPFANRYRYPFTNCTNCGPRFSIIEGAPYDRSATTMSAFDMCAGCKSEFVNPEDRRFHAQPIACHACGPRAWVEHLGGGVVNLEAFSMMDDVDAAGGMLMNGHIIAVKGLGGFHLACDATRADVVAQLREKKKRKRKAFALMARDLDVIRTYADVSDEEVELLTSAAAPIVLLKAKPNALPDAVAPGLDRLGFMLPHTPLHHLMLRRMKRPIVMTSGNISGQPQVVSNEACRDKLGAVAEFALLHDRDIANRIDDSVARVDLDRSRILRRARGYAPQGLSLPEGFDRDAQVIALGSELKNTFCVVKDGSAILSQHMGDLEDAATFDDVQHNLTLYAKMFDHKAEAIAVDAHCEYLSTKHGFEIAGDRPVIEVQHHHAHIAACMFENGRALDAPPVLGVALDGLGLGNDGTLWGGEFLVCNYRGYQRVGTFKPVALPGGAAAVREPWRNAYAHLMAEMGWSEFAMNFHELKVFKALEAAPRETLDAMISSGTNTPLSSSCGRLFDAASALAGIAWDRQDYEGEAAMVFEAALDPAALDEPDDHIYPFAIPLLSGNGLPYIEPLGVWRAILGDRLLNTPVGVISARFHRGLARAVAQMVARITNDSDLDTVVLSGGCFQNQTLFTMVHAQLQDMGLTVLTHEKIPTNDGGLAVGQAAIALAKLHNKEKGRS